MPNAKNYVVCIKSGVTGLTLPGVGRPLDGDVEVEMTPLAFAQMSPSQISSVTVTQAPVGGLTQEDLDALASDEEVEVAIAATASTLTARLDALETSLADLAAAPAEVASDGGAGGLTLIQTVVGAPWQSLVFDNIPQTFKALRLVGRTKVASTSASTPMMTVRFNDVATSTYHTTYHLVEGHTGSHYSVYAQSLGYLGHATGLIHPADSHGLLVVDLLNYRETQAAAKHWTSVSHALHGSAFSELRAMTTHGMWMSKDPITKILIGEGQQVGFAATTEVSLYGVA